MQQHEALITIATCACNRSYAPYHHKTSADAHSPRPCKYMSRESCHTKSSATQCKQQRCKEMPPYPQRPMRFAACWTVKAPAASASTFTRAQTTTIYALGDGDALDDQGAVAKAKHEMIPFKQRIGHYARASHSRFKDFTRNWTCVCLDSYLTNTRLFGKRATCA